jgi:hypothetical protein
MEWRVFVSRPWVDVKLLAGSSQVRADLPGRCLRLLLAYLDDPPTSGTAVEVFRTDREQRNEEK